MIPAHLSNLIPSHSPPYHHVLFAIAHFFLKATTLTLSNHFTLPFSLPEIFLYSLPSFFSLCLKYFSSSPASWLYLIIQGSAWAFFCIIFLKFPGPEWLLYFHSNFFPSYYPIWYFLQHLTLSEIISLIYFLIVCVPQWNNSSIINNNEKNLKVFINYSGFRSTLVEWVSKLAVACSLFIAAWWWWALVLKSKLHLNPALLITTFKSKLPTSSELQFLIYKVRIIVSTS